MATMGGWKTKTGAGALITAAAVAYLNHNGYMQEYAAAKEALGFFGLGMGALGIGDKIRKGIDVLTEVFLNGENIISELEVEVPDDDEEAE